MLFDGGSIQDHDSWYLVHCQPGRETYAARSLRRLLNLSVFLPENHVRLRGEIRSMPFFPGYLFALADLQKVSLSAINTCPGVLRLVGFGGCPQPVPSPVVETIARQLDRLREGGMPPYYPFCPGDTVRMKSGPLQDLQMVFVGSAGPGHRVHILLELMGRLTKTQVDVGALERSPVSVSLESNKPFVADGLNCSSPIHRGCAPAELAVGNSKPHVRYTRGKGRKIHRSQEQYKEKA